MEKYFQHKDRLSLILAGNIPFSVENMTCALYVW